MLCGGFKVREYNMFLTFPGSSCGQKSLPVASEYTEVEGELYILWPQSLFHRMQKMEQKNTAGTPRNMQMGKQRLKQKQTN